MDASIPILDVDCNCIMQFLNDRFDKLSDLSLNKLSEFGLISIQHNPNEYIDITYIKTVSGIKITELIQNNPNYINDINAINRVIRTSNNDLSVSSHNQICCKTFWELALELYKFYPA